MMNALQRGPCIAARWYPPVSTLCPSKQATHEVLKSLYQAKLIEMLDEDVSFKGFGANHNVYVANGAYYKGNQLKHDVIVGIVDELLGDCRMGWETKCPYYPDLVHNKTLHIEIDTGSMGYQELVSKRYQKYRNCPHWVLWISCGFWGTKDTTRLEEMCKQSKEIADCAWFCTYGDLLEKGWQTTLINYYDTELPLTKLLTSQPIGSDLDSHDTEPTLLESDQVKMVGSILQTT